MAHLFGAAGGDDGDDAVANSQMSVLAPAAGGAKKPKLRDAPVTADEARAIHAQLVVPWLREMGQQGGLVIED